MKGVNNHLLISRYLASAEHVLGPVRGIRKASENKITKSLALTQLPCYWSRQTQ